MHATVAIFFKAEGKEIPSYSDVESKMEPYSEQSEVSETRTISEAVNAFRKSAEATIVYYEKCLVDMPKIHKAYDKVAFKTRIDEAKKQLVWDSARVIKYLTETNNNYIDDFGRVDSFDLDKGTVDVHNMNPEGTFDWYVIGGRWRGSVLCTDSKADEDTFIYGEGSSFDLVNGDLKRQSFPDGCYVNDLSIEGLIKLNEGQLERIKLEPEKNFFRSSKEDYIKETEARHKTATLDSHINRNISAIIDLEDEWHSCEGARSFVSDYIKENYSENLYVVIVDYHY